MTETVRSERGLDRLVNFSDAVVAIAITLLVLPLVDLISSRDYDEAWLVISDNGLKFAGFALTFFVTAIFWMRHHQLFERIGCYDYGLLWLNMLWLLFIVLLPFSSGLVSEAGFADGGGFVYACTMACLSLTQGLIALWVQRHPELMAEGVTAGQFRLYRAWVYASFFVSIGLVSLFQPVLASYLMLLLFPLGRLTR